MHDNLSFDKRHIWHPYTSMAHPIKNYLVDSAIGYELILYNGRRLIDGMSSWWASIHGYNNPIINQAIQDQINRMSHVMFGGITHIPAINLCRNLIKLTPKELECIFLADSGSVSVEIAIKMVFQYWKNLNKPKYKLAALCSGYHGDTFGAMSVSYFHNHIMHNVYKNYLSSQKFVRIPSNYLKKEWKEENSQYLSKFFLRYRDSLGAIIVEPIVQGAGGMKFYHKKYLRYIRELCNQYNVLLIVDEIATGFGRTGKWFACEHAKIVPDIMCLGKALTGGYLTLSATLTTRRIANIISSGEEKCFMHGPTFMANPLACSAANANLSILKSGLWIKNVKKISSHLKKGLFPLQSHKMVKDVRVFGAIGVVETIFPVEIEKLQSWFVNQGVWIRPFKNLIYIMPPYIISMPALSKLIDAIGESLNYKENFLI